jgi:hypothetical protein
MAESTNIPPQTDRPNFSERFLGAWALVSCEHRPSSSEVVKLFGDDPSGQLLYETGGHMSAQLSVGTPNRLAGEDFLQASDLEAAEAWRKYIGYWGTFKVHPDQSLIIHRVEGSSFSNWIGTEQHRHFRFDDSNRLILEADSPSGHTMLIWQRKSS